MLQDFRKIDITWDKANQRIYTNLRTSSSDEHGRKLVVQVLNNAQVEDLTGVNLNLYWETKNKEHNGLDVFNVIDASKGIFELYFTTGMLSNIGELNAHLHLLDGTGALTSELFKITVFKGIDGEAVESSDSFTTLTKALTRVVEIETQEDERKQAESDRVSAENTREANESTRKSNESSRNTAESDRAAAESLRESAENLRKTTEEARALAESSRVSAEDIRESNENTRKSDESIRDQTFNQLVDDAENLIEQLDQKYDNFEDEYAPRLTEIEQNYIWFGIVEEI